MEETRKVALAYYANCSDEFKQKTRRFFNRIDADGSGKISRYEYVNYFKGISKNFNAKVFAELDYNGDGFLDFEESIVFFYMVHYRKFWCDNCGEYLKSVYFTCSDCFLKKRCYDLCVTCFGSKKFKHEHQDFVDNHAMLNCTRSALQDVQKEMELKTQTVAVSNTETTDEGLRDIAWEVARTVNTQTVAVSNTETAYEGLQDIAWEVAGTVNTQTVAVSNSETADEGLGDIAEVVSQCSIM